MILLVDIGNSRSKYCSYNKAQLSKVDAIENGEFTIDFFNRHFTQATKIIVASVAKEQLTDTLALWCKEHEINFQRIKSEKHKAQLISAYEKPEQLGIDRWLALVATSQLYPNESVLIIDAGTATTVDYLSPSGQHFGGWILAGINTLFSSIIERTTNVHAKTIVAPSLSFGLNTNDNVSNACWAATIGTINVAIEQAKFHCSTLDKIIITGGNAKSLQNLLSEKEITYIEDLVFYGLKAYIHDN